VTLTRRELLTGAGTLGTLTVLPASAWGQDAGAAAFPVTIEHIYGTTVIPEEPVRVVAAGFNDSDYALAFGLVPVGVRDFIGPFPEETRPWAQAALGGAEPVKVSGPDGELNFERVAVLRPDLILAYSYLDEAEYETLAQIAPTLVETEDGALWQRHTLDTGRALGQPERARELVAEAAAQFVRAIEEHPEFEGTVAAIQFGDAETGFFLLEPTDPRFGFFASLGFEAPEQTGEVSRERVDLLDQGGVLIVFGATREAFADEPLFQGLAAVREGRVAYLGGFETEFAGAVGFDSPLSLPYALDLAVPVLAAALDGDPSTSTPT